MTTAAALVEEASALMGVDLRRAEATASSTASLVGAVPADAKPRPRR